jgi:hypothetical protein
MADKALPHKCSLMEIKMEEETIMNQTVTTVNTTANAVSDASNDTAETAIENTADSAGTADAAAVDSAASDAAATGLADDTEEGATDASESDASVADEGMAGDMTTESADSAASDGTASDSVSADTASADSGYISDSGDYSMDGGTDTYSETGTVDAQAAPMLSHVWFICVVSVVVIAFGITAGILLAKHKIKKGINIYEE